MRALFIAAFVLVSFAAQARDLRILVINKSNQRIVAMFASNVHKNHWEEDMIHDGGIPPHSSRIVNLEEGDGYCRYDLRAVGNYGGEWVKGNVNACVAETWTLYE